MSKIPKILIFAVFFNLIVSVLAQGQLDAQKLYDNPTFGNNDAAVNTKLETARQSSDLAKITDEICGNKTGNDTCIEQMQSQAYQTNTGYEPIQQILSVSKMWQTIKFVSKAVFWLPATMETYYTLLPKPLEIIFYWATLIWQVIILLLMARWVFGR